MIGFVGLSHLGIVSSIATASKNFDVIAFDPNRELVSSLRQGNLPFFEPDLPQLLQSCRQRIEFTFDIKQLEKCDIVYISQDVKTNAQNISDIEALRSLINEISAYLKKESICVILSQVPPGFCRSTSSTLGIQLIYQVETLIFGRAVERALYPERIIVGLSESVHSLPKPYQELLERFNCPILTMRYESAELAKISINMCLVSSISVANTLAEICEKIGADWSEIVPALKLDKRIGPDAYLSAGLGIAGGNLERDLVTACHLANNYGTDAQVVESWLANSQYRSNWVLRLLNSQVYSKDKNATLAILGLAYKPNTNSIKNSPSLQLLKTLKDKRLQVYDPQVKLGSTVASVEEALKGVDALVIMTAWKEFESISLDRLVSSMKGRVVIDPYGCLSKLDLKKNGFHYFRLGA